MQQKSSVTYKTVSTWQRIYVHESQSASCLSKFGAGNATRYNFAKDAVGVCHACHRTTTNFTGKLLLGWAERGTCRKASGERHLPWVKQARWSNGRTNLSVRNTVLQAAEKEVWKQQKRKNGNTSEKEEWKQQKRKRNEKKKGLSG